eukprot:60737_1
MSAFSVQIRGVSVTVLSEEGRAQDSNWVVLAEILKALGYKKSRQNGPMNQYRNLLHGWAKKDSRVIIEDHFTKKCPRLYSSTQRLSRVPVPCVSKTGFAYLVTIMRGYDPNKAGVTHLMKFQARYMEEMFGNAELPCPRGALESSPCCSQFSDSEDALDEDTLSFDDRLYDVEKIIDKRVKAEKIEYLVKWEGYSDRWNTWETAQPSFQELVDKFERNFKPNQKNRKRAPSQKSAPPPPKNRRVPKPPTKFVPRNFSEIVDESSILT